MLTSRLFPGRDADASGESSPRLPTIKSWRTSDAAAEVTRQRRILVAEQEGREQAFAVEQEARQGRVSAAKEAYRIALATEAVGGPSSDNAAQALHAAERELTLFEQRYAYGHSQAALTYFDTVITGDLLRADIEQEAEAMSAAYRAHVPKVRRLLEALESALARLDQLNDQRLTDFNFEAPMMRQVRPVLCAEALLPMRVHHVRQALAVVDQWEAAERARS